MNLTPMGHGIGASMPALSLLVEKPGGHTPGASISSGDRARSSQRKLLCARCRRVITDDSARIEVDGRHRHVFANPHAFTFEIGCFAQAAGVVAVGPRSSEFSWFPGYTWQILVCGACHGHLGWRFQLAGNQFLGLILERLVADVD